MSKDWTAAEINTIAAGGVTYSCEEYLFTLAQPGDDNENAYSPMQRALGPHFMLTPRTASEDTTSVGPSIGAILIPIGAITAITMS